MSQKVIVRLKAEDVFTSEVASGKHLLIADEPESEGGKDLGPAPYDLLCASLGSCTAMTIRMYTDLKKWELESVEVALKHSKVVINDSDGNPTNDKKDHILREITLLGNLDEKQKERIIKIANKCPVHKTLSPAIEIETVLIS